MGLEIEDVSFINVSLGETIGTDYLLDNIGDIVTATIKLRFDGDYVIATSLTANDGDTVIIANAGSNLTNVIRDERHLWTDSVVGFGNVSEGDEITIDDRIGGVTTKVVLEVINSQLLLMDSSYGPSAITYPVNTVAYVSTPMQAIEYSFGLIENQEPVNYFSKTDGSEQKSRAQGISSATLTDTVMVQLGNKSYQYGGLEIKGNEIGDGPIDPEVSQAFIITHTFLIGPLSLAGQNEDLKNGKSPDYFNDLNSLKYAFKAELSKDLTDPNRKKEVIEFTTLGNCGFLDENFNTGLTNYAISNLVFRRANNDINEAIELVTDQTTVEFTINNTVDSPFSTGNTKFVLNHWLMPTPEEEYREPQFSNAVNLAKDRNIVENFIFDRVECTLDDVVSNAPDNIGGDEQVIIDCLVEYISDSRVNVRATLGMSAESVSKISALSIREYILSVSVKNHALPRASSDKVTLGIDINNYFTDTTDPSMVGITNTFIDHPNSDVDAGATTLTVRTDDDVVAVSKFVLDRNDIAGFTRQGVEIGFSQITAQIIARKDADTFFVLDSFNRNLPPNRNKDIAPYGTVPIIGITEDRGFRTPADALRQNIVVKRRTDLDAGGGFHYELYLPFIFRWEGWAALEGVNDHFYDESLPNNGLNHDWARYAADPDWNIFYQFTLIATKDGIPIPYTKESQIFVEDYTEGTEWDTEEAKGFLVSSGLEITKGGQSGISLDEPTRIEGSMTFNTTPLPTLPDLVMVLMVNVFEKENFKAQYRISSLYPNTTTDNVLIGLLGASTATKDDSLSPVFSVKAETKPNLLAKEQEFRFSWRFYDTRPDLGVPFGKLMEDGTPKQDESGIIKEVE